MSNTHSAERGKEKCRAEADKICLGKFDCGDSGEWEIDVMSLQKS